MSTIKGRAWKYGDNVNTDAIFSGKYTYTITDPSEMAGHALEDLDPRFAKEVHRNDIIVAGRNWGCGSSREQAVMCLKESGVGAIIAKSFARIYYRNLLNAGLPALTCPEAVDCIREGEEIEINLTSGEIRCDAGVFKFPSLAGHLMSIFEEGGLVRYVQKRLQTIKEDR